MWLGGDPEAVESRKDYSTPSRFFAFRTMRSTPAESGSDWLSVWDVELDLILSY